MSNIQLNVLFKKMQKDDKKEVLQFHYMDSELPNAQELIDLSGSVVVLSLEAENTEKVAAQFKKVQKDDKKTLLEFNVNTSSKGKIDKFYPYSGTNVKLTIEPSQMSIEEFYKTSDEEEKEQEVTAEGQLSLEEVSQ